MFLDNVFFHFHLSSSHNAIRKVSILTFDSLFTDNTLYLVVESAPRRFLLETEGESNEEKQEIDENADTVAAIPHAAAPRGWMDRMKKQRMKRKNSNDFGREGRNRNMIKTLIWPPFLG